MTRIALIGGTGFGQSLFGGTPEVVGTPYGDAQVTLATRNGAELLFLARHGTGHSVPPHRINHRANVHALREWGADAVLATTAVGSLKLDVAPGDFVVPDDLLDLTKGDVVTFYDETVRHTDMSEPYSNAVRQVLLSTAPDNRAVHAGGTYVCLSGPRYETPAEIRLLASWGGAVVGMTGAPEVILCREAGLRYAAVSLATNYGCGLAGPETLAHTDVEQRMAAGRATLAAWLLRAVDALSGAKGKVLQKNYGRRQVLTLAAVTALTALLAGCGGGGGGGGGSTSGPSTVTITGTLKDTNTGGALASRIVTVQGTGLSGTSGLDGTFTIAGVTVGAVVLVVTDTNGATDGTYPVDLRTLSGNPRSVGTITFNVTGAGGGPPPPPGA